MALSEYEISRARKVEANNAYLRELGLISRQEELRSNAIAWGKDIPESAKETGKDKTITKKRIATSPEKPSRKSRRLQGDEPEFEKGVKGEECFATHEDIVEETEEERIARVEECRRQRQIAAVKYAEIQGAAKAAKENPTATYEHTLKRCRTMSEKGLINRVKAIERAAGKHCVIKMAIFKSCLQDEGMWDIAELAGAALERLKGLQAPE